MEGKCKWFASKKGYGFIQGDDGKDIFVHHTAILCDGYKELQEGQRVKFDVVNGNKGLAAENVVKL